MVNVGNLGQAGRYNNQNSHAMEESTLIGQAQNGDIQAFQQLVLRYQRPLFRFLHGYGLSASRVEEIAQETFLKAYQNLKSYRPEKGARFMTWLFVIAKRLSLNELARSEYRYPSVELAEAMTVQCKEPTPAESLANAQQQQQVLAALHQVKEPYHSALMLSYIEELSLAEIAKIEQCSIGTVKSRIYRGKQILAGLLANILEADT
ncbi:MAG: sigma-70 family RNA polymerase sigma factor [Gammaproteobacteria bacterium]